MNTGKTRMKAWSNTNQNHSRIDIKNIAICMYGQYRTGDACLEYIKRFYDIPGVNVDYFCSLKPYETTYTRHKYNKENNKDLMEQDILNKDMINHQTNQIKKHYNPKQFKIYSLKKENQLKDIEGSIMHSKVLAAWVDSIMLKQKHEAKHNITYDMVIMQRYDTIIWPSVAFNNIFHRLQGLDVSHRSTLATGDKNLLFFQPIEFIRKYNGTFGYPNGQDLWAIGIGNALDVWAYDALEHIPSMYQSNYSPRQFRSGYPHIDTHEMLGSITKKMNIPHSMFPILAKDGSVAFPLENIKHNKYYQMIAPMVIRESYWEKGKIPNIAELSDNELEDFYNDVMVVKWERGD